MTRNVLARRALGPASRSAAVRKLVWHRAGGCCERCGQAIDISGRDYSFHHRRPRAMGGTKRTSSHGVSNLLLLDGSGTTGCHGYVEANRTWAYEAGYLIRQTGEPADIRVLIGGHRWVRLPSSGEYVDAEPPGDCA